MKILRNIALATVFSLGVIAQSIANATAIAEYDAMTSDDRSGVISKASQDNIGATADGSDSVELTQCMADYFTKVPDGVEADTPLGILILGAQIQLQRDKGNADTMQIEEVVRAVYASWLKNNCLKEHTPCKQKVNRLYPPNTGNPRARMSTCNHYLFPTASNFRRDRNSKT